MKKLVLLIILGAALTGCDDGLVTEEEASEAGRVLQQWGQQMKDAAE